MSRFAKRSTAGALLLILTTAGAVHGTSRARFVALVPGPDEGSWSAVVEAKGGAKAIVKLSFRAGERLVEPEVEELSGDRVRLSFRGLPAGAELLELGTEKKKGFAPSAAVRLSPLREDRPGDWVIYHIMMGYFRNGSSANDGEINRWRHANYAGGDLQGVLEKAEYLRDLGVNAVWLSPIFQADTSHGYDVADYYRVGSSVAVPENPQASLTLFRETRDKLRELGIKVILDLPLNHASAAYDRKAGDPGNLGPRSTGARQEAEKVWEGWGTSYRYWNFDHAPTREFLKGVARYWLEDEGVDGLRMDYVRGVPHDFWAELHAEIRQGRSGKFVVGECWADAEGAEGNALEIARYYEPVAGLGPQFDSLLDFPMQIAATQVFAGRSPALYLEEILQSTQALYGPGAMPTYFLDNHDTSRFAAWSDDPDRLVAALGFLSSLSGPLVLFYGTETGLADATPKPGFIDAGRIPMPWGSLDESLIERVREVLRIRAEHPALTHGARLPIAADKDHLLMAKRTGDETLLVGVNLTDEPLKAELGADWGDRFEAVLGGSLPVSREGALVWELAPMSTSIVAIEGRP